jgi:hypothetical protein
MSLQPWSLQQKMRDKVERGGYIRNKYIRVMTSYHEDITKRFYKYILVSIYIPTKEELRNLLAREKEQINRLKVHDELKIWFRNYIPKTFYVATRYAHPFFTR